MNALRRLYEWWDRVTVGLPCEWCGRFTSRDSIDMHTQCDSCYQRVREEAEETAEREGYGPR